MSENTPEPQGNVEVDPQDNEGQAWWQEWLTARFADGMLLTISSGPNASETLTLPPKAFEFIPDDPSDSEFSESEKPAGMLRIVAINVDSEFPIGFTVDTSSADPEEETAGDGRMRVHVRATDGKAITMSAHISDVHKAMVNQLKQERGL